MLIFIIINLLWNTITFISGIIITLLLVALLTLTTPRLQPYFFTIRLVFASTNICFAKIRPKEPKLFYLRPSSKSSFKKVLKTLGHLLILLKVRLSKISNINKRKFRTKLPISNIFNLFSLNLMLTGLQKSLFLFAHSQKGLNL